MEIYKRYQDSWRVLYHSFDIYPRSRVFVNDVSIGHIHALELGEGEPIILLHGFGTNSDSFAGLLAHLSKKYRVIVPDFPGVGLSGSFNYSRVDLVDLSVKFLNTLLDYFEIPKATFIGDSLGGFAQYQFSKVYPHKVNKMLFLGALPGFNEYLPLSIRVFTLPFWAKNGLPGQTKEDLNGSRLFYGQFFLNELDHLGEKHLNTMHFANVLPGVVRNYLKIFQNFYNPFGSRKKYRITRQFNPDIPYHFIIGKQDQFFKPELVLPEEIPTITYVENAGHFFWIDNLKVSEKLISEFLEGKLTHKLPENSNKESLQAG